MSHTSVPHYKEEHFSLSLFLFTVVATLAGLALVLWLLLPAQTWQEQLHSRGWTYVAAFLAFSLFNAFVEFFFHRYVLHKPVVPFLSRFYRQHTKHHSLTRIGRKQTPAGREVPFIENQFPMIHAEQHEASFFPWYTLIAFSAFIAPLLALLQWVLPSFPWFFGGLAALASSVTLYEVFHAIEHWPFEKWGPLIDSAKVGKFWRMVYSFHLRHHAVIDCNEAISGFFTLPVPDWAFGTFILPKTLYTDGEEWAPAQFVSPEPCRFIRWLDRFTDNQVAQRRLRARNEPARALVFTRGEKIATWLTHGLGLLISCAALALLVTFACLRGDVLHVVTFSIFGATLVLLYAFSLLYHSLRSGEAKRLIFRFKRAAVFLLIAGTYTPFLLISMRGPWGWTLFGVVWGLCVTGVVLQFLFAERFKAALSIGTLVVGWLAIIAIKPMIAVLPDGGFWLVLAGGLCYTVGTLVNRWERLRYQQALRRAFILGGSVCHVIAVLLFVLPG